MKNRILTMALAGSVLAFSSSIQAGLEHCRITKLFLKKSDIIRLKGISVHTRCTEQVKGVTATIYHRRGKNAAKRIHTIRNRILQKSLPYGEGQWLKIPRKKFPENLTGMLMVKLEKSGRSLLAKASLRPTRFRLSKKGIIHDGSGNLARNCKIFWFRAKPGKWKLANSLEFKFRYICKRHQATMMHVFRGFSRSRRVRLTRVQSYPLFKGRARTVRVVRNYSARRATSGYIELRLSGNGNIRYRRTIEPYRWKFIPKARDHRKPRPTQKR